MLEKEFKITKETKVKFTGLSIYENGRRREINLDELLEFEKEGYIIEIKLVKPAVVKEMSINFERIEEEIK